MFQFLNGNADVGDIVKSFNSWITPNWDEMTLDELKQSAALFGHCSALIKVTPGYEDIVIGHSMWAGYSTMLRVFKHYSFNLETPSTSTRNLSFSSYPGILASIDDYYILGNGLIVLETTNDIFNNSLYELIKPESLLSWQRVRGACQMAHGAREWTDVVARYNSGTYNNQYMILDLNKVKLKQSIEDNTFWIAEQIPGLVASGDLTPILRAGYFASYNKPYFEEVDFNLVII